MPSLATDKSDGRFRTEPQNEFVGLRFDYLLGDVEMRQIGDAAQKWDVALTQLEDGTILDATRQ